MFIFKSIGHAVYGSGRACKYRQDFRSAALITRYLHTFHVSNFTQKQEPTKHLEVTVSFHQSESEIDDIWRNTILLRYEYLRIGISYGLSRWNSHSQYAEIAVLEVTSRVDVYCLFDTNHQLAPLSTNITSICIHLSLSTAELCNAFL